MRHLGFNISEYRNRKKWTQAELARKACIAQANLSNIEKGKRDLTVSTLIRIADALEISIVELFEDTTPPRELKLNRINIERLAEVILSPHVKAPAEIRAWAGLFREVLLQGNSRASSNKIQKTWLKLRQQFSSSEIRGVSERVEDQRQRLHAQKTN